MVRAKEKTTEVTEHKETPENEKGGIEEQERDWRADLIVGPQPVPPRIGLYGTHGIGKSTMGSLFPSPIFISTEDGLSSLDTVSFPQAKVIADVVNNIYTLIHKAHDFQTLVLDTADWLVSPLIEEDIQSSYTDQERSYGKEQMFISESFREILQGLDRCRDDRNMNIVVLAHANIVRFDSPITEPYDRYEPKLPKRCNAIFQEWVDALGFMGSKIIVKKSEVGFNKEVTRGVSVGKRLIHWVETPAVIAKNRYGCPPTTPMTMDEIVKYIPVIGA